MKCSTKDHKLPPKAEQDARTVELELLWWPLLARLGRLEHAARLNAAALLQRDARVAVVLASRRVLAKVGDEAVARGAKGVAHLQPHALVGGCRHFKNIG